MGKKQDEVMHLIAIGQSRRGNVAPVIVQPGTRDPLGAFYELRATDWKRTPELRVPLYDGSDLYEMRAHVEVASGNRGDCAGKLSGDADCDSSFHAWEGSAADEFFRVAGA